MLSMKIHKERHEDITRLGMAAAAECDKSTGLPISCFTVQQNVSPAEETLEMACDLCCSEAGSWLDAAHLHAWEPQDRHASQASIPNWLSINAKSAASSRR